VGRPTIAPGLVSSRIDVDLNDSAYSAVEDVVAGTAAANAEECRVATMRRQGGAIGQRVQESNSNAELFAAAGRAGRAECRPLGPLDVVVERDVTAVAGDRCKVPSAVEVGIISSAESAEVVRRCMDPGAPTGSSSHASLIFAPRISLLRTEDCSKRA